MRLEKLTLQNFKNYADARVDFDGSIHCFLGKNGSGKTNLLDAIYYLSFTRSSINPSDQQNIRKGQSNFVIKGDFTRAGTHHSVVCTYSEGHKKSIREDEHETTKLSQHIGRYPVVLVAPNDIELIWDGSELRRKFFDSLISQLDPAYLENLIVYNQYLKQRNGLLRIFSESGTTDPDMLEAYDQKLIPAGEYVFQSRKSFMARFHPLFENHYRFMSDESTERVTIDYQSQLLHSDLRMALSERLTRDIQLQRTTAGIHRDDFVFTIDQGELRRMGSQGQQKSFLIALKLTEFEILSAEKKFKPLLLLDDIFDKLDDGRIRQLMALVSRQTFGQLFITDARTRSREIVDQAGVQATFWEVGGGTVQPLLPSRRH